MANFFTVLQEEDLICPICLEFLNEPTTVCCGHLFCKRCITKWNLKKKRCPLCKSRVVNRITIVGGDELIDLALAGMEPELTERRKAEKRAREEEVELLPRPKKARRPRRRANPTPTPSGEPS